MPPEILALIDRPLSLIAVLFVGALAGMWVEQFIIKQRRAAWKRKNEGRWKKGQPGARPSDVATGPWAAKLGLAPEKVPDAADQLRTVMKADFKAQPLLNKSE